MVFHKTSTSKNLMSLPYTPCVQIVRQKTKPRDSGKRCLSAQASRLQKFNLQVEQVVLVAEHDEMWFSFEKG